MLCRSVFLRVLSLCLRVLTTDSLFFVFAFIALYILLVHTAVYRLFMGTKRPRLEQSRFICS